MLDKKFWQQINNNQAEYDKSRRIIISQANIALHKSKQAIFAVHRENLKDAGEKIQEAKKILQELEKKFVDNKKLRYEGAWCAAVEEFVEANLLYNYVGDKKVGKIQDLRIEATEYLGGFADYSGELVRKIILLASKRKFKQVEEIVEEIREIINILLEFNLTGVLRTKFDQAKKNLHKAEQVLYEINLKD